MIHLNEDQVVDLLQNKEEQIIQQMENVFNDFHTGVAEMVPKIYLNNKSGDFRAMPARWGDYSGVKWISVYPNNYKQNLPTIHGTLLLNDTYTGEPIVSMDCAQLTAYRTAAVSALAAKYLTLNGQVRTCTYIGCGYQAKIHVRMYRHIYPRLDKIRLYDKNKEAAFELRQWILDNNVGSRNGVLPSVCDNISDACLGSDLITTLTPSIKPYLGQSHIKDSVHINAVGADAEGKRELERSIWMKSTLVVDDYEQASHSGEAQYVPDVPYMTLGKVLTQCNTLYTHKATVFDSTGLAIEDIAIGKFIYEEYCKGN